MTRWRQWAEHPEKSRLRHAIFQCHLIVGAFASTYVALMSISGSIVIWQGELYRHVPIEWLVKAHDNLMLRSNGQTINGIGGIVLTMLCLTGAVIWWPGVAHWKRSLKVEWRASFPRLNWDLHSAAGFWTFPLLAVWGVTGTYFGLPVLFNFLFLADPSDRYIDRGLYLLSILHFGRFAWLAKVVWSVLGLAPAVLAFTGVFICCRRVMFHKPSNPKTAVN